MCSTRQCSGRTCSTPLSAGPNNLPREHTKKKKILKDWFVFINVRKNKMGNEITEWEMRRRRRRQRIIPLIHYSFQLSLDNNNNNNNKKEEGGIRWDVERRQTIGCSFSRRNKWNERLATTLHHRLYTERARDSSAGECISSICPDSVCLSDSHSLRLTPLLPHHTYNMQYNSDIL